MAAAVASGSKSSDSAASGSSRKASSGLIPQSTHPSQSSQLPYTTLSADGGGGLRGRLGPAGEAVVGVGCGANCTEAGDPFAAAAVRWHFQDGFYCRRDDAAGKTSCACFGQLCNDQSKPKPAERKTALSAAGKTTAVGAVFILIPSLITFVANF